MSKEVIDPVAPPAEPQGDGWLLDDNAGKKSGWVLDDAETPAEEPTPPAGAPPTPPAVAPGALPGQGYQYTTKTGHTFRGATPDDVAAQLEAAVERAGNIIVASNAERDAARSQLQFQGGRERGTSKPEPAAVPFDTERYYTLLADKKPLEAADYLDSYRSNEKLEFAYNSAVKTSEKFEMADFRTENQDWPNTAQANDLLLRELGWGEDKEGMPITRWNLEVGKNRIYARGQIQALAPAAPAVVPIHQPQSRGAAAPPAPRTGPGGPTGERELSEAELMALPPAEHKKYLQQRGYRV